MDNIFLCLLFIIIYLCLLFLCLIIELQEMFKMLSLIILFKLDHDGFIYFLKLLIDLQVSMIISDRIRIMDLEIRWI